MLDLLATLNQTVEKFDKVFKEFNAKVKQLAPAKAAAEPTSK